ncbi:hypothetical protein [Ottowia thiooxydans]|uniref:hypothetical protein n=1 Tax=Ottowia thiooxydans TaxID=219182 RepID=UPI00048FE095|nr:hypothetical protein [Ottowia thiooxydans]
MQTKASSARFLGACLLQAKNPALQPAHDDELELDGRADAFELAGLGVTSGLESQLLAFLGKALLERDAHVFGSLHQLGARCPQQAAIGGVGNRLVLHRPMDYGLGKLLQLDQLEI